MSQVSALGSVKLQKASGQLRFTIELSWCDPLEVIQRWRHSLRSRVSGAASRSESRDLDVALMPVRKYPCEVAMNLKGEFVADPNLICYHASPNVGYARLDHDARDGGGRADGVDETIACDLGQLPPTVERVAVLVSLYNAHVSRMTFADVPKAQLVVKDQSGSQIFVCHLGDTLGRVREMLAKRMIVKAPAAMIVGYFERDGDDWSFLHDPLGFENSKDMFWHFLVESV